MYKFLSLNLVLVKMAKLISNSQKYEIKNKKGKIIKRISYVIVFLFMTTYHMVDSKLSRKDDIISVIPKQEKNRIVQTINYIVPHTDIWHNIIYKQNNQHKYYLPDAKVLESIIIQP